MPAGRPTKFNDKYCAKVIEFGKQGMTVAQMASRLGVCKATIYHWATQNNKFSDALTRARTEAEAHFTDILHEGLIKQPSEFQGSNVLKYMGMRFHGWADPDQEKEPQKIEIVLATPPDKTPD